MVKETFSNDAIIEIKKERIKQIMLNLLAELKRTDNVDLSGFLVSFVADVKLSKQEQETIGQPNLLITINNINEMTLGLAADAVSLAFNTSVRYVLSDEDIDKKTIHFIANRIMHNISETIEMLARMSIGDDKKQLEEFNKLMQETHVTPKS